MSKIKLIRVFAGEGKMGVYEIGERGIARIVDNSIDGENVFLRQFDCYDKDNKLLFEIIGGALVVEYEKD